jgi:beta-N-acetylglucosaminidase/Glycosyl hydrolase family 20, domain 2
MILRQKNRLMIIVAFLAGSTVINANEILNDNFNRKGNIHGSKTSDGKYAWFVSPAKSRKKLQVKQERMNFNAAGGIMCVRNKAMRQRDFELAFDFAQLDKSYARSLAINYRLQGKYPCNRLSNGGYTSGYTLEIMRPARNMMRLRLLKDNIKTGKPDIVIAETELEVGNRWNVITRIRLLVEGERHRVFVNEADTPAIDAMDKEHVTAGWWNIVDGGLRRRVIDNLSFKSGGPGASPAPKARISKKTMHKDSIKPLWSMHYTGRVTPTPRKILSEWKILPLAKYGLKVEIADDAHNAIGLARNMLLERTSKYSKKADSASGRKLTVYLGELESKYIRGIASKLKIKLDDVTLQPQGYVIRRKGDKIIAAGVDSRGTFYAAMTLYQSIGTPNGKLILRCADLNDWPAWQYRYNASYPVPHKQGLLFMAMHKISGLTVQTRWDWRQITPKGRTYGKYKNMGAALTALKIFNDRYDLLDYQFILNIYARSEPVLNITNEQDIAELVKVCAYIATTGIRHIMIAADDWTPSRNGRYVCSYPAESKRFNDSAGRSHGYLMKRLYDALKPRFPELDLAFVPAPYSLLTHNKITGKVANHRYLRDMAREMPDDVYVVWTGPEIRSWNITRKNFLDWQSCLDNRHRSYVWDNTGNPPPIRRWATKFYEGFNADSQGIIFINTDLFGKAYRVAFSINANDFLWNPKGYQEKISYRDAVEKLYGPGTADTADAFIEKFTELHETNPPRKKALELIDELDALIPTMKKDGWQTTHRIQKELKSRRARAEVIVPILRVKRLVKAPVLDGKLDDACWQETESFRFLPASGKDDKIETGTCRMSYDDKYLYLGFSLQRSKALSAPVKLKHDQPLWRISDDNIEIFLQCEKRAHAQLIFDSAGNRVDSAFNAGIGKGWNPNWQVAVHTTNNRDWSAEVMIPLSLGPVIEENVKPGTVWRANFIRNVHKTKPSAWSPPKGNRNNTSQMFGKLVFE